MSCRSVGRSSCSSILVFCLLMDYLIERFSSVSEHMYNVAAISKVPLPHHWAVIREFNFALNAGYHAYIILSLLVESYPL